MRQAGARCRKSRRRRLGSGARYRRGALRFGFRVTRSALERAVTSYLASLHLSAPALRQSGLSLGAAARPLDAERVQIADSSGRVSFPSPASAPMCSRTMDSVRTSQWRRAPQRRALPCTPASRHIAFGILRAVRPRSSRPSACRSAPGPCETA